MSITNMTDQQAADIWLRQAISQLKQTGFETPALDARLLLQHIAGIDQVALMAGRAEPLDADMQDKLNTALRRRLNHESVHRILGYRSFYGLDFKLAQDTLEPRPDTETLIDLVLPVLKTKAEEKQKESNEPLRLLDMGTGSGAIALAFLANMAELYAIGADIAAGAVKAAADNAKSLGLDTRFKAIKSDWFAAIDGQFDFIVSNPPYIPHADIAALEADVKDYDPHRALDGGADGLNFYRALAENGQNYLHDNGYIAVEIGIYQALDVMAIFTAQGFSHQKTQKDLAGIERALLFKLP